MRQGILNVRATVVAALAFAGVVASIPTQALELYNNSSKVCDFTTFNFDGSRMTVACGSTTPATKACMTTSTTGSFTVESPATDHSQVGTGTTRKVRFNRGGTCVGAYDLYYNIAAVNLTGWSFNGGTSNSKVHFNEGDEYVDVDFTAGTTDGWFLVQLSGGTSTAVPVPPAPTVTVAKQDWWMDIKTGVTPNPTPTQPSPTVPAGCPSTSATIEENIASATAYDVALSTGQERAYSFTMPQVTNSGSVVQIGTYEAPRLVGGDHQIVVAKCPGDFSTASNPCNAVFAPVGFSFTVGTIGSGSGQCQLQGGQKYYINLRYVNPNTLQNSCPTGSNGVCHELLSITIPQ